MEERLGTVRIAPEVLVTIARLTTLAVPGVVRMSPELTSGVNRLLGRRGWSEGVKIEVEDDTVSADLHIIVEPNVNLLRLGRQIQAEVTKAINDIVGMPVKEVNIFIQDVESPLAEG